MPLERINLDTYIPFYEVINLRELKDGAVRVYLRGDREINTDAVKVAVIRNLRSLGLNPNATLPSLSKQLKKKIIRLNGIPAPIDIPKKCEVQSSIRWIILRLPEAGFSLFLTRHSAQIIQFANWVIDDPFPIFMRKYLSKIGYPHVLKVLAETNPTVYQWILYHWKKIKEIDRMRHLFKYGVWNFLPI